MDNATGCAAVLSTFIVNLPATLAALGALVIAMRNGKKTDAVHTAVNSRMDELLETSGAVAHEAGRQEGLDEA